MPFASTRRRSRGIVSKESSVVSDPAYIWKVENEGIDSMRERFRIKECRMEGRTISSRLSSHEPSDEGIEEEMNEEGERRTRITKSMLKVFNDVIGVPVPRRARSGSKRKSHPALIAAQPSSKNGAIGADGESSISESELEVANLLCGLTTLHSQHFDASHATTDALLSSPVPCISALPKESKRRKSCNLLSDYTEKPSTMVTCKSNSYGFTNKMNETDSVCSLSIINGHQAESSVIKGMMVMSPKLGEDASFSNAGQSKIESHMHALQNLRPILAEEKSSPTSPINCELFSSPDHSEKPSSTFLKQGETQSIVGCQAQNRSTEQLTDEEPNQLLQDIPSLSSQDEKIDPHISAASVSSVNGCVKKVKYDIDLMAPPDDGEIAKCNSQASQFSQMDIRDRRPNQDSNMLNLDKEPHLKGVTKDRPEEQIVIGGKTGTQDEKELYKTGPKLDSQGTGKDNIHTVEKAGPSNVISAPSTPIPISIPCWPGVRPFGFLNAGSASLSVLPSLQGASRVEGNSTMLHAPLVMLPPKRPGRCATHCFIAQLTYFQQQLTNVNSFWHAAGGGPSGRPYGITSVPPPPGALVLGGPFIRNPSAVSGGSSVSGSVVTLNSQYPVANCNSLQDHEKGKHSLIQKPHQGAVLLFPASQMKSPMVGAKASQCSESGGLLPTSSVLSTVSGLTSTSSSNLVANVDPRYRTMFKGNYSFSSKPGYQPYSQQHRPSTPLFYGSSGSSHVYSPLQLTQNPSISTGSSSQLRPFLHLPNDSADAIPRSNNSKQVEVLHSQRQSQPMNPVANQANTALRDHTNKSSEQSQLNNLRKQSVFQTNSRITSPSTSTSTHAATSMANSDHFSSKRQLCSEKMLSPCHENISSGKDSPMLSATTAVKAQKSQFPNLTPIHKNASGPIHKNASGQVFFAGSINVRPTISQQAQLGSSMGLTKMAAGSHAQVSASLQMKSAGEKRTAA